MPRMRAGSRVRRGGGPKGRGGSGRRAGDRARATKKTDPERFHKLLVEAAEMARSEPRAAVERIGNIANILRSEGCRPSALTEKNVADLAAVLEPRFKDPSFPEPDGTRDRVLVNGLLRWAARVYGMGKRHKALGALQCVERVGNGFIKSEARARAKEYAARERANAREREAQRSAGSEAGPHEVYGPDYQFAFKESLRRAAFRAVCPVCHEVMRGFGSSLICDRCGDGA